MRASTRQIRQMWRYLLKHSASRRYFRNCFAPSRHHILICYCFGYVIDRHDFSYFFGSRHCGVGDDLVAGAPGSVILQGSATAAARRWPGVGIGL